MEVDPVQELHRAAEEGDIEFIKASLKSGVNIEAPDHDNNTALHIAAANDHENAVAFLLTAGANRESTNNLGWTPLMQAARHGHMQVVSRLINAGALVDAYNRLGMSALMLASVSGHMGTIRTLIEAGAKYDPEITNASSQITPLMIAAQHGNNAVVRLYLDKGVSANKAIPKIGITPLMFSAAGGNVSTAQLLLDRGADANATSACDLTALDVASASNRPDIVNCLEKVTTRQKKKGAGYDLMEAVRNGDLKSAQEILIADPGQSQITASDGATPLMIAAMFGHYQIAKLLLQYGAPIDAQDQKNGWTALMQAIYHRHTELAKLLIKCGADTNKVAHRGYTAYDFASETLDIDIMSIFVEAQMSSQQLSSPSPTPQVGWSQQRGSSQEIASLSSKHGLKHWWNRVSNRFNKVKGVKVHRSTSEDDSLGDISLLPPMVPIHYDPILPQELKLPPIMDFEDGSIYVTETMKNMVPPLISPTGGKPGFVSKAMPPGRKIVPGGPLELPHHATNSHLLKTSLGSGGRLSPGSSLSGPSPQSSGEARGLGHILKGGGRRGLDKKKVGGSSSGESNLLGSSLDSGGSGGSSLKTVTSSKSSKSSKSSHSTATLTPQTGEEQHVTNSSAHHLTLSLGSGQLSEVLQKLALNQYLNLFIEQEVDLDVFLELSDEDLQDLGISTAKAREKILKAIASLKAKVNS
ncbi:ankyrin repeat and SAM domain-containing protein 6-like [Macrobrachium rosenbergii]|uniref:ankyrin repeat and SAM domain-containing protein 6-like n=1 Tax=Macrobrachium rosenbergii TaxID=79674 RepID=UPI0034D4A6E2